MAVYEFAYDAQIERVVGQFMRVFSGFQVRDGVDRGSGFLTNRVPVTFCKTDRLIQDAISGRGYFKSQSIPVMAAFTNGLQIDKQEHVPKFHSDHFPTGENNTESIKRLVGPSFKLNMGLSLMVSSNDELYQLLEQILLIFNPKITINVDDKLDNPNYITEIELTDISDETPIELGTNKQAYMVTLSFEIPFRLKYKHSIQTDVINEITQNIIDHDSESIIITDGVTI